MRWRNEQKEVEERGGFLMKSAAQLEVEKPLTFLRLILKRKEEAGNFASRSFTSMEGPPCCNVLC